MNKMSEVAKLLGVEMGERFEIKGKNGLYFFNLDGLILEENEPFSLTYMLYSLIIGEHRIIKQPWKPKIGEMYYSIFTGGDGGGIDYTTWYGGFDDLCNYKMGNVFRTENEAKSHKMRFLTWLDEGEQITDRRE